MMTRNSLSKEIDGQAQSDQPEIQEWTKAVIEAL